MDSVALFVSEGLFPDHHPKIESFDYFWSIISDLKKAESVENSLQEIVYGCSNLGLDTKIANIEYEKMQSSIIFGSLQVLSWLIFLFSMEVILSGWMVCRQKKQSLVEQMRAME